MKLFKKFFFTTTVIILVSMTLIAGVLTFLVSNYFSNEKFKLLQDNCNAVSKIFINDIHSNNFKKNAYNLITIQNNISGVDIFLTDNTGKILICGCNNFATEMQCNHSNIVISKQTLANVSKNNYFKVGNLGGIYENEHYTYAIPVKDNSNVLYGYVFASTSTETLKILMIKIFKIFIFSAIIPLILMFIALYAMSYNITKPLKLMSQAAKLMAKGDFSKRIPVYNNDEIGELSASFNSMSKSLADLEKMRRSFIADVSHELRTPMTTISGFIDGIIDGTIPAEKHNYYLNIILNETTRLSRLVESMLNISKLESGTININKTKFNLTKMLVNIVINREQQIKEKNIEIVGLDKLDDIYIFADYDLIYQVVYNLTDNAVKFTNENGKIEFYKTENNTQIELNIKNTGEGIDNNNLNFIFDRFYKTDKSRSADKNGTGLGLYIVKTIVELHKGKITATSIPNEFTEFKVTLPINLN
ncbi:MAG: HAMP domain-containing protein [Clostridia bacterium]|nr:HAMP domain-containing protein [Clostridia bacterium]